MCHRVQRNDRRLALSALVLCGAVFPAMAARVRSLGFEDRVRAQREIERVYYTHQIGARRPFEDVVSREILEAKVRTYLRQTVALRTYWGVTVTDDMLRAELKRMSLRTKLPERLRELYGALGNDSMLVLECLARPALVDRLSRNFFSYDRAIHADSRREAEALREQLIDGRVDLLADRSDREIVHLVRGDRRTGSIPEGPAQPSASGLAADGTRLTLEPEAFERWLARVPARNHEIGPVEEERDLFIIRTVLNRSSDELEFVSFTIQKKSWNAWWPEVSEGLDAELPKTSGARLRDPATPGVLDGATPGPDCPGDAWDNGSMDDVPDSRYGHTAVWTGSLMLVWGGSGYGNPALGTGGRYDPATDTWSRMSMSGAPAGRSGHTAVWTGDLMVIWGGNNGSDFNSGGRYDPVIDTWTATSLAGAPPGLLRQAAVWTGSQMIVWGPINSSYSMAGGRYNPVNNTWTQMTSTGAPTTRDGETAVWTGTAVLFWGGFDCSFRCTPSNAGFRYDPVADVWSSMSTAGAPSGRYAHSAVWTGREMIVWGGDAGAFTGFNTGGRYDPLIDRWTSTSTTGAASSRYGHTAVWTGANMIVWGGEGSLNTGGRYDPASDTWLAASTANAPAGRSSHTAIWDGSRMIVWGGRGGGSSLPPFDTGGRYNPSVDSWTPTSTGGAPAARRQQTAVWTGSVMIIWGGGNGFSVLSSGARYDPAIDTWSATSTLNPPSARAGHTAVWTGQEMVVWGGGDGNALLATGGRYDPQSDAWTAISTILAASARSGHTAVWTGREMVVWGGWTGVVALNSGGRYDPATDRWIATSTTLAPQARSDHTAVWTGNEMMVWGGTTAPSNGGRYDPAADTWKPMSSVSAPAPRSWHNAIWTGRLMVIWGGFACAGSTCSRTNTGGRYDPVTDAWTATSTANAPTPRAFQTAVWTGEVMIVWGGTGSIPAASLIPLSTGARYHPPSDSWAPTSLEDAPGARYWHSAVWTGTTMLVWGGSYLSSGGRYCPGTVPIFYHDADGDQFGEPNAPLQTFNQPPSYVTNGDDCNDADSTWWATPSEVLNLQLPDPGTLQWSAPLQKGGFFVLYDGIRSSFPSDFVSDAACVATDFSALTCSDPEAPGLGRSFFYLVRAQNGCPQGQGTAGSGSDGTPRAARSCP
ncbi:MAG TPA: hypothetical protein VEW47_18025 [Candidatus Dormibacteraeota bacterium]|nr:hypothetical protein [Candidatus Dormibacteraeota bacterium]